MAKRVVVTGLGAVTPVGNNVGTFWRNIVAGKSGVDVVKHFDVSGFESQIAGEVRDFDPSAIVDKKEARRLDLFVQYALVAAQEAIQQAQIDCKAMDQYRIGSIIGCGIGGIGVAEVQEQILMTKGPGRVSPFLVPMMIPNMAPAMVAIKFGFRGPNVAVVSACASGNNAFADAVRLIQRGDADVLIAGGTESAITPLSIAGFCSAKALSTRNHEPQRASRPFDRERDGFVIAEGCGLAVLESLEHAQARGANILAEIGGYGMTDDAFHITAPLPDGAGGAKAMELAILDAGLKPEDIDYINAHGTSTEQGDIGETVAIKKIFGAHAKKLQISSTKSMIGHTLGAAGGIEFVAVVKSIMEQTLHPTINLDNPDPACDLDYITEGARQTTVNCVLTNSFGFGGHNVSVLVKRYAG
ncbi:beta-ketoacyl-ACP synthase II [candidate division FCPU426 bacterium]|nr:beta-ketoacyl-ACP synthase II [candidate division FCPU426 bacterium]